MAQKKSDPTNALVTVMQALDPLEDADRQWVLLSAAARWSLPVPAAGANLQNVNLGGATNALGGGGQPAAVSDPKAFLLSKDPESDIQRVAVLAYILTHGKDTPTFKTRDLTSVNTEAKGTKFNTTRGVSNAARAKYLSAVGGGKKQLSSYGEQIVDALPSQEAVKALDAKQKKGRRKKSSSKRKKKATNK